MTIIKAFLLVTFILSAFCSADVHDDDVHVIELNKETFSDAVSSNNNFIMFYAPW